MMMVPTYPEDDSRALKVYQHQHHGSPWLCGSGTRRLLSELRVQLSRDCAGRFGWNLHGLTARAALCDTMKMAGGGTSVHAFSVFPREKV